MRKKETLVKNQNGIASMVIVILIMTLLSLIVIAMTRNANREQRQALDRQLNSQAFYAAESGINDARDYYTKHANDPINPAPEDKSNCNPLTGASTGDQFPGHASKVGDSVNAYSCVIYDSTPNTLKFSDIGTDNSVLMPLEDKSGGVIKGLTFTWRKPNNTVYNFSGCPSSGFPKTLDNCDAGVLRVELIDPNVGSVATARQDLISNDFLSFLSPSTSPSPATDYGDGKGPLKQGVAWKGNCTGDTCSLTINNINRAKLMLHLRSMYKNNDVEIAGVTSTGTTIQFKNGQIMVDSTGRASDVLKRIQVYSPINQYGNGVYPEFSLQTATGVCKLLQIIPPGFSALSSADSSCYP